MTAIHAPFVGVTTETSQATPMGETVGSVRTWLRLEGLAAFGAGLVLFAVNGGDWLFLVPLLLLPDISMVAYTAGPRVGSIGYNLIHNWAVGFAALLIGLWLDSPAVLLLAAVLIAHVGMDRALGYGLKSPSAFQDTHLGRIGREQS